jgi:Flp pilus assembly pilin Flp
MQIATYAITWILSRLHREEGQDLLEYGLFGGLIAAAILAALLSGVLTSAIDFMAVGVSNCIDFNSATACSGI